jgi:hypothetical protein
MHFDDDSYLDQNVTPAWWSSVHQKMQTSDMIGAIYRMRLRIIQQYDYPFPEIIQCGGDTAMGELIRQQNLRLNSFRDGVRINADEDGRESKAPRRGVVSDKPVWYKFPSEQSRHNDFELKAITRCGF